MEVIRWSSAVNTPNWHDHAAGTRLNTFTTPTPNGRRPGIEHRSRNVCGNTLWC